jgi:DNA-binding HxlR family transcriptional regulator
VPDVVESGSDPPARALRAWTPLARALAVTGDRWTLSIAVALAPGRMRLTHLHKCLPGISTGVLERGLQQMVALGLVTRTRFKEMPPRVELELTDAGHELLPIAAALARWGKRHMWSAPREDERVDLDVLLRLLPALVAEQTPPPAAGGLSEGLLEVLVTDTDPPIRYRYRAKDGRLSVDERLADPPEDPSAGIHGDAAAWVVALGPGGDYSRLRLIGDERLAKGVLARLPGPIDRGLSQWAE